MTDRRTASPRRSLPLRAIFAWPLALFTLGLVATGGSDYHGDLMSYAEAHATLDVPASVAEAIRQATN